MAELQKGSSQVFLTTHSAAALSAASETTLWYVDSTGAIGQLPASVLLQRERDFEAFLARVAIIAEGVTEVGFVTSLLKRAIDSDLLAHGIWVSDAGGNDNTLKLLEGLVGSGVRFGGFADDEGRDSGKWAAVQSKLGKLLFRWPSGCLEENIIKLVPVERLEEFIKDPDGNSGERLRTLADRLGMAEKEFSAVKAKAPELTALIIEAASGAVPDSKKNADKGERKALKKHAEKWFKSVEGGGELATKVFTFGLWPQLENQILPFLNAIRGAVSLPEITKLPS